MNESVFRIGFSEHQQIGDQATIAFVSQHLRELLTTYRKQAQQPNQDVVAYSALAIESEMIVN